SQTVALAVENALLEVGPAQKRGEHRRQVIRAEDARDRRRQLPAADVGIGIIEPRRVNDLVARVVPDTGALDGRARRGLAVPCVLCLAEASQRRAVGALSRSLSGRSGGGPWPPQRWARGAGDARLRVVVERDAVLLGEGRCGRFRAEKKGRDRECML